MRVLDLYCGAGGAAAGYAKEGADLAGVDILSQPNYPFEFARMDALRFLSRLIDGATWSIPNKWGTRPVQLNDFDLIHASPPCQLYSAGNRAHTANPHPDLVDVTRDLLKASGKPWVIENVVGAPLIDPITLCGRMFGLGATDTDGEWLTLDRHRVFEASFPIHQPEHPKHDRALQVAGVYGGARRDKHEARHVRHGGYVPAELSVLRELLGIDWMSEKELFLAIPPVYTEYIYDQFVNRAED